MREYPCAAIPFLPLKPLIACHPVPVFVLDEGQAGHCWVNPRCWHAELNKDMVSIVTAVGDKGLMAPAMTVEPFGKRSTSDEYGSTSCEEGLWLLSRDGKYDLSTRETPSPRTSSVRGLRHSRSPRLQNWCPKNIRPVTRGTNHGGIIIGGRMGLPSSTNTESRGVAVPGYSRERTRLTAAARSAAGPRPQKCTKR